MTLSDRDIMKIKRARPSKCLTQWQTCIECLRRIKVVNDKLIYNTVKIILDRKCGAQVKTLLLNISEALGKAHKLSESILVAIK